MFVLGVTRVICKGRIKIVPLDIDILKLTEMNWNIEDWDAIVYVVDDLTLDEIDDIVAHRNDSQEKCEYLWSHPTYTKGGGNQAPFPIIIQQDRAQLMELRYAKKRWTLKRKRKINCNNPKGFSQKQYCLRQKRGGKYKSGRKKKT